MSVETRGRQAGEGLRRASNFDVESGLLRVRRTRRRRDIVRVAAAAVVLAAAVGGVLAVRDRDAALEPVKPLPVRNGEIMPPEHGQLGWRDFDQPSGLFLRLTPPDDDVTTGPFGDFTVVGKDGEVARMPCPFSSACGPAAFGPGSQELSMVDQGGMVDGTRPKLHIVGYDGVERDAIALPGAVAGTMPSSIDWSPDGSRLAVSTDCERAPANCKAQVWIIERDGGSPRLVHSEPAPPARVKGTKLKPLIRQLAWSPDGNTLTFITHFIAHVDDCGAASDVGVWASLVALKIHGARAEGPQTLHVYDDIDCHGDMLPYHYPAHYNFAWSPDGTRLAVTGANGFTEISATDGQVLARHPLPFGTGQDHVTGPLAWLRAP
jgi:WD40-like Beta Propeller Repeat